jgi:hypothetical protein
MVTRDFVDSAASAWRAAGCSFQRPDVYEAAARITAQAPDNHQLAAHLNTTSPQR